ncbi:MAG: glycosyltransferase [Chlorobiales bacterium]|nr:glycosyltransferase [Chlorobiales bacterium]
MKPLVSVLMPVYNGEKHLSDAVKSILWQTYHNFEFLIMDDGSTDNSVSIVESYKDLRIKLHRSKSNSGIAKTLNRGIDLAQGKYIARMDCDDISHPDRLLRQVTFLEQYHDTGVLGSGIQKLKGDRSGRKKHWPESDAAIKINLLFQNPVFHPTVILRKSILNNTKYPETMRYSQDYGLWVMLATVTQFANLPEALLQYRTHPDQVTKTKAQQQADSARIAREYYLKTLFPDVTEKELILHHRISERDREINLIETAAWLEKIISLNDKAKAFPTEILQEIMARKWWNCCKNSTNNGAYIWRTYNQCSLSKIKTDEPKHTAKYVIKWLINKH